MTKRTVIHQGKFREKRPFHHLTVPRFSSLEKRTRTGNEFGSCACMISSTATKCQTARAIEFFGISLTLFAHQILHKLLFTNAAIPGTFQNNSLWNLFFRRREARGTVSSIMGNSNIENKITQIKPLMSIF